MNRTHRVLLLSAFLTLFVGFPESSVFAQSTDMGSPDPSRRLDPVDTFGFPGQGEDSRDEVFPQLEEENRFAPPSAGDRDIGEQLILKEAPKQRRLRLLWDINAFSTDNAGNTPSGEVSDSFLGSQLRVGWQARLAGRWFADLEISQSVFRYDRFDVLDFEVFEAGANLVHVLPQFGNVVLFVGPQFQRITNNTFQDELVTTVSVSGGLQKIFLLDRRNSIHLSAMVDRDLSNDIDQIFRNEYSAEAAWRFKIMRDLVLTPSVRYTLFDYTRVPRDDALTVAGLSLTWMPKRWLEVTVMGTTTWNDSTLEIFDFETTTFGGGLGVKLRF
jgi:hypothetical protein